MSTDLLTPEAASVLARAPNPQLRRVRVSETDQAIVLRGTVSSYYLKQLAQECLRSVAEGRRIVNLLEVRRPAVPTAPTLASPKKL